MAPPPPSVRDAGLDPTVAIPTVPPTPPPSGPPPGPPPAGGSGRPAWLVPVLLAAIALVGIGIVVTGGGGDGGGSSATTVAGRATTTDPGGRRTTTTSDDDRESTTTTAAGRPSTSQIPTSSSATTTAPPGVDASGQPVSYAVTNVHDGNRTTAWRTAGDGAGVEVTLRFATAINVTSVGLIPGYDKVDSTDGSDRFTENRRIVRALYVFDDGTQVEARFADSRTVQTTAVDVVSRTVVIRILETTANPSRDFTAISEVEVLGFTV